MRDVLFIGLDIETPLRYDSFVPGQEVHVGLSIPETRSIQESITGGMPLHKATKTYQYAIANPLDSKPSKYIERASCMLLFGSVKRVTSLSDTKPLWDRLTRGRHTVLAHHGGHCSDQRVFETLAVDNTPACVLDTGLAAQHPMQLPYRPNLGVLLDKLQVPHGMMHAAGNDVHFCLHLLIMLAVKDCAKEGSSDAILQHLAQLALQPLPQDQADFYDEQEQNHDIQGPITQEIVPAGKKLEAELERKEKRVAKASARRIMVERARQCDSDEEDLMEGLQDLDLAASDAESSMYNDYFYDPHWA